MKKGYLVLADGTVYEGIRFGADASAAGELVFKYATTILTYSVAFGSLDLTGGLTP